MPNLATLAGLTAAICAPSGVLVLDAPRRCAFVLRPGWRTQLPRSEARQRHEVRH